MKKELDKIKFGFSNIVIFRDILKTKVIKKLIKFLNSDDEIKTVDLYSDFLYELFKYGDTLADYLLEEIFKDENVCAKKRILKREIGGELRKALKNELNFFRYVSAFDFSKLLDCQKYKEYYEKSFKTPIKEIDFCGLYENRLKNMHKDGYGIFYKDNMFIIDEKKNITAVKNKDNQNIKNLYGYENERNKVVSNARVLIEGRKTDNVLLYGDAGTGKSSTVKAVANLFKDEGLRLIELKKNQLHLINELAETLSASPLKFIIFIDDLTFSYGEDNFSYLKAALEGGVNSLPDNVAVYVTSNYRHLIKENFGDRNGDEVHIEDAMQQIKSLANRFGTIITFQKPDKELFMEIVLSYAKDNNIKTDKDELIRMAEAYAIRSSGRSPRAARQFIESLKR